MTKLSILGRGTFGSVFLVQDCISSNYLALKQLSKVNLVKAKQGLRAVAERNILRECDSPFVIKLFEVSPVAVLRSSDLRYRLLLTRRRLSATRLAFIF